jgi:peptide methionine sulfoxide reductase msrA/msrB
MSDSTAFDQPQAKLTELQANPNWKVATLAGGCFWCLQAPYEQEKGVAGVLAGYTGGKRHNPNYDQVITGVTGHRESVQVYFNPREISYEKILDIYWLQIDPTDPGGQFGDRGEQYRTAIYYHDELQKKLAEKSKQAHQPMYDKPLAVQILPAQPFYIAEDYHQSYYKKEPDHYYAYSVGSGRKAQIEKNKELKKK